MWKQTDTTQNEMRAVLCPVPRVSRDNSLLKS
jgi:hypothetical protein